MAPPASTSGEGNPRWKYSPSHAEGKEQREPAGINITQKDGLMIVILLTYYHNVKLIKSSSSKAKYLTRYLRSFRI
jgi:hypothetical protein